MKTKSWNRGRVRAVVLALVALGGSIASIGPASAQVRARESREECRCVDRDGNPIENCRCLHTPNVIVSSLLGSRGARLGVTLDPDQDPRNSAEGARIATVLEGGPADDAGLREGDVITRIDGHGLLEPLDEETEDRFDLDRSIPVQRLMAIARRLEPGEEVEVEYMRDGARHTTRLEAADLGRVRARALGSDWDADALAGRMRELSERMRDRTYVWEAPDAKGFGLVVPEGGRTLRVHPGEGGMAGLVWSMAGGGLELTEMKPGLSAYFGTDHGVLVTEVDDSSELGLEPGDVILSIHGRTVETPAQVRRILSSYGDDETVSIRIMRQKSETTVQGRVSR